MNQETLRVSIVQRSQLEGDQKPIRFQQDHEHGVFTEWNSEMEGYRRIIDFLVGKFTVRCISFEIIRYDFGEFLEYVEYPKSRGIKFNKVRIWDSRGKEGIAERMLSACSDASELDVMLKSTQSIAFNGFHEFTVDKLYVSLKNSEWFTVDHMCALQNCSKVLVNALNHWKDVDLNKFLKFWIKSTGRLRAVCVNKWDSQFNPELAMNGIDKIELDQNITFQIQRDSGLKARVEFSRTQFSLHVIDA